MCQRLAQDPPLLEVPRPRFPSNPITPRTAARLQTSRDPRHPRTRSGGDVALIQNPRSARRDHFLTILARNSIAFHAAPVGLNAPPTTPSRQAPAQPTTPKTSSGAESPPAGAPCAAQSPPAGTHPRGRVGPPPAPSRRPRAGEGGLMHPPTSLAALAVGLALLAAPAARAAGAPQITATWTTDVSRHLGQPPRRGRPRGRRHHLPLRIPHRSRLPGQPQPGTKASPAPPRRPPAPKRPSARPPPTPKPPSTSRRLAAATAYRYRVLATNSAAGTATGPTLTFTTEAAGRRFALPDHRGWEMVSPLEKNGGAGPGPRREPRRRRPPGRRRRRSRSPTAPPPPSAKAPRAPRPPASTSPRRAAIRLGRPRTSPRRPSRAPTAMTPTASPTSSSPPTSPAACC